MFKSIIEAAKSSPFAGPFQAKCEGLQVNENRQIQAASAEPGKISIAYKMNLHVFYNVITDKYNRGTKSVKIIST